MMTTKPKQKVRNCEICGKPYIDISGRKMCPECYAKEDAIAGDVIRYVRDHPKASQEEVIEETGVSLSFLRQMIREGRFEMTDMKVTYPCSVCGAPIIKGKLCASCTAAMQKRLHRAAHTIMEKQKQADLDRARRMFVSRVEPKDK